MVVPERKHWLDYVLTIATCGAAVGAACAAWFAGYQVSISQDVEKRQLRAYVEVIFVENNNAVISFSPDKRLIFAFYMQNKGQTPAFNVKGAGHVEMIKYPIDRNFDFPLNFSEMETTLFPNNTDPHYLYLYHDVLTDSEKKQIAFEGDYRFVMYGTITYTDAFGEDHFTTMCWTYYLSAGNGYTSRCHLHNDGN
jgi:hypothetical protein